MKGLKSSPRMSTLSPLPEMSSPPHCTEEASSPSSKDNLAALLELFGQHSNRSPSVLKIFTDKLSSPSYLNRRRSPRLNLQPRAKTFHPCVRSKSPLARKRVTTRTAPCGHPSTRIHR